MNRTTHYAFAFLAALALGVAGCSGNAASIDDATSELQVAAAAAAAPKCTDALAPQLKVTTLEVVNKFIDEKWKPRAAKGLVAAYQQAGYTIAESDVVFVASTLPIRSHVESPHSEYAEFVVNIPPPDMVVHLADGTVDQFTDPLSDDTIGDIRVSIPMRGDDAWPTFDAVGHPKGYVCVFTSYDFDQTYIAYENAATHEGYFDVSLHGVASDMTLSVSLPLPATH